jgi:vacuolar-type H+-ATPase subunit F/Vma7
MSRVVAIGEAPRVAGYALAGVEVRAADDPAAAVGAWRSLGPETELVVLTPAAASALAGELREAPSPVWVVLPE